MAKKKNEYKVTISEPKKNEPIKINHGINYDFKKNVWWEAESDGDKANCFVSIAKRAKDAFESIRTRRMSNIENIIAYNDISFNELRPQLDDLGITLNVIKSCATTAQAKIAKIKPKPKYLTEGGNFAQKDKAKKLTQYVSGVFDLNEFYSQAQQAWLHSAIAQLGAIKIFANKEGDIKTDLVPMGSIVIHESQATDTRNPFELFDIRQRNKFELIAEYPEFKAEIISAASDFVSNKNRNKYKSDSDSDLVMVIEAYKLSFDGKKDGKRAVIIDNATLEFEDRDKKYFPYAFFRYRNSTGSFYGDSMASEILPIQKEINKLLTNIQIGCDLVAKPRMWMPMNANMEKAVISKIDNEIGKVYNYSGGTPPRVDAPSAASTDVYNHLKWLDSKAYFITGVSGLSAGSEKPSGLNSGKALREYSDIETERFSIISQQYERSHITASKIIVDVASDTYDDGKIVTLKGKDFIEKISWKDIRIDSDAYITQCFPASQLPDTPSGRLETVIDMINGGFISQSDGFELLDMPDLEGFANLQLASKKAIERDLYTIAYEKKYRAPEKGINLEEARSYATKFYLECRNDDAGDEVLDLISRYLDDVQRLIDLTQAEAPSQPMVTGVPGTAPQSPTQAPQPLPA